MGWWIAKSQGKSSVFGRNESPVFGRFSVKRGAQGIIMRVEKPSPEEFEQTSKRQTTGRVSTTWSANQVKRSNVSPLLMTILGW